MKKLFIGILLFAVIAIGVTGTLIKIENNKVATEKNETANVLFGEGNKNQTNEKSDSDISNEKTIDLYGTYDENDLVVEEIEEQITLFNHTVTIDIPVIKGLKDKSIEEKINNDIKQRIIEKVTEVSQKENVTEIDTYARIDYNFANFSNVISYQWRISYEITGEKRYNYEDVFFNYELVNGERLKFEDLFVKNADLYSVVRRMFYRQAARDVLGGEIDSSAYYDKTSEMWVRDTWDYFTGEDITIEYTPYLTEYDIAKKIDAFMGCEDKKFHFTPSCVYIIDNLTGNSYYFYLKDIAEDVVIYDKYKTEESIYESSDIGMKNLWTCSEPNFMNNQFLEYGFAEENLYYEITMNCYSNGADANYPFAESLKRIKSQLVDSALSKLEYYKKIAKENPNEFYVLSINSYYEVEDWDFTNQIFTSIEECLTSTDIKYKVDVIDELLEAYRYHNVGFYGGGLGYAGYKYDQRNNEYYEGNIIFNSFESKNEEKVYDARDLKELTSVDEVFKKGVNYMNVLATNLKNKITRYSHFSAEELNELINGTTYTLTSMGIKAKVPNGKEYKIYYNDIEKYLLDIYDLDMYIHPDTDKRKIVKAEIQLLSKEDLNRAYNEIFARHGHDFKNKELREYFELCSWYEPVQNKSVTLEELSDIERYNLEIIKMVIDESEN